MKLTINVALNDLLATYYEEGARTVDLSRWMEVEKESDVIVGMVNDAMDDLQNLSVARSGLENSNDNDSRSDTRPSHPIPTAVRLTELFLGLEELAY